MVGAQRGSLGQSRGSGRASWRKRHQDCDLRDKETNQEEARRVSQTDKHTRAKRREGIFPLEQRFSNFSVCETPTGPPCLFSADRALESGLRCCISNTLPADARVTGIGTTL